MLPHLFRKIGHRYVNMEIMPIKVIHSASIISDPNNMLTSTADKSGSRWKRSNSRKFYILRRTHKQIYGDKQIWTKYLFIQMCYSTCFGWPVLFFVQQEWFPQLLHCIYTTNFFFFFFFFNTTPQLWWHSAC